jgi:hypothetical protein
MLTETANKCRIPSCPRSAAATNPDESLEKEAFHVSVDQSLNTRMMYLDLIDFVS